MGPEQTVRTVGEVLYGRHGKADVVPASERDGEQGEEHRCVDLKAHTVCRRRAGTRTERTGRSNLDLRNAVHRREERRSLGNLPEPTPPVAQQEAGHANEDASDQTSLD